jgi:hypothetical protein
MSRSLKNGYLFGKLLTQMQSTYIKRTKKFFPQNARLTEVKDNDAVSNRKNNWGLLFQELKNYGLDVDKPTQQKVVEGNPK